MGTKSYHDNWLLNVLGITPEMISFESVTLIMLVCGIVLTFGCLFLLWALGD